MKRTLTLVLVSLLLTLGLTGCGRDQQNSTAYDNTRTADAASREDGRTDGTLNDGMFDSTRHYSDTTDTQDAIVKRGRDIMDDIERDVLDENNENRTDKNIGSTYDQMLRNAQVHDTNGDLTDTESDRAAKER